MNPPIQNYSKIIRQIISVIIVIFAVAIGSIYLWQKLILKDETPPEITPVSINAGKEASFRSQENIPPEDVEENLCDKEIVLEQKLGQKLTVDYCTHLKNSNGMKIYFARDNGNLIIYTAREAEGRDYLLDTLILASVRLPYEYIPVNVYANGERIVVTSFDELEVAFKLEDNCPENYSYCNTISENTNNFYFVRNNQFEYFYDNALFGSDKERDNYVDRAKSADQKSINFLRDNLGIFPPIDKLVQFSVYEPDVSGVSFSSGFWITNRRAEKISAEQLENFRYGNTHEFIHVFFYGTPVRGRIWFEEGLADYMEHAEQGTGGLFCRESGWEEGYLDLDGNFVSNSPLVPYSDFSAGPQYGAEFFNPLSRASYYSSAECFWVYIREKYGDDAIKNVARAWHNTRIILPPEEKQFIKNIVNPALGGDLSELVKKRYNYIEE